MHCYTRATVWAPPVRTGVGAGIIAIAVLILLALGLIFNNFVF